MPAARQTPPAPDLPTSPRPPSADARIAQPLRRLAMVIGMTLSLASPAARAAETSAADGVGKPAGAPAARPAPPKPVPPKPASTRPDSARPGSTRPPSANTARAARPAATAGAAAAGTAAAAQAAPTDDLARQPAVRDFVKTMVEEHRFDEDELLAFFGKVRLVPEVLRLIAPPPPGFRRSWSGYRGRFVEPLRIRDGLRFWSAHEAVIARASERYGVPAEIIVAIIGVETIYGRVMGEFRVADALTTLALRDPRRASYFRDELTEFLLHTRDTRLDPLSVRGSYAGASGIPQFMPASIRRFAVDFDGDGAIDLRASPADAIGSVGRFLAEHGWRTGEPTHFRARIDDAARAQKLIDGGIEPRVRPPQLAEHGLASPDDIAPDMPLALIDLPDGDGPTIYRLGGPNFYVITRYNRSNFYAMAVIELAETLRAERRR
jgi:membrane-bound lytic murein transglycosylase B